MSVQARKPADRIRRTNKKDRLLPSGLSFDLPGAEFIFGLVAPVGTDTSGIKATLETGLKKFGYEPHVLRISDFLIEVDTGIKLSDKTEYDRIRTRMDAGNKACRRARRNDVLALAASAAISQSRERDAVTHRGKAQPHHARILISLKRREEVLALRRIYGAGFLLISVFATDDERLTHLTEVVGMSTEQATELIRRDRNEADPHGQATREAFHLADIFVRTANGEYQQQLTRFLDLLFGYPFHTASQDEHGMFLAFAAALRSADLSRQIGAAVVTAYGEVIGTGCNDVPKAGGGLYGPNQQDQRDYIRGEDTNEIRRNELIREIVVTLFPKNTAKRQMTEDRSFKRVGRGSGAEKPRPITRLAIQQVHVAGMDAVAVVDHGEVADACGVKTIDRQHHVSGIHRVNQMRDDAVHLLPHVDLPFVIIAVDLNPVIRRSETYVFRFAVFMNHDKTDGRDPHHASILPRDDLGHFAKPFHDTARLHRDFGNALHQ